MEDLSVTDPQEIVAASGYAVLRSFVALDNLPPLQEESDRLLRTSTSRGGARNILGKSPLLQDLAMAGPPAQAAAAILGSGARPTKLTVFDRPLR